MKKTAFALAAAVAACTCFAATPVAVWDGDFDTSVKTGTDGKTFTLSVPDASWVQNDGTLKIGSGTQSASIAVTGGVQGEKLSILMEYSGATAQECAVPLYVAEDAYFGLRTKKDSVSLNVVGHFWNNNTEYPTSGDVVTTMPESGYLLFVFPQGTVEAYSGATRDALSGGSISAFSFSNKTLQKIGLGGCFEDGSSKSLNNFENLVIRRVAIFTSAITTNDVAAYTFPSETQVIDVASDTSVSAINALFDPANYTAATVSVADGVTIDVNAAFSANIRSVSSAGTITLSADSQPDASYLSNVDFSGVQGGLLRSWYASSVVGVNFVKNYGKDATGELVASDSWLDTTGASGTSTELFADGLTKVTWSASNVYGYKDYSGVEDDTILFGYLDDGSNKGHGPEITVENIPYETYDVVIYASTDTRNAHFQPKTVNGMTYTVDAAGAVSEGNAVWGSSRLETPVYGSNAMRVKNLSGPLTIYGGLNTYSSNSARGGIAAIQIMPSGAKDKDNIYTLALGGTTTAWSSGSWKIGSGAASAPSTGFAKITLTASTTLIVDTEVSLTQLVVEGEEDAVLTMSLTSGGSFVANASVVVKGCVLQQGSAAVLGATPSVAVEDGATFDMNGYGVNSATAFTIAGAGAGNWPWALTSSSGAGGAILGGLYLSANATIGGANELKIGQTGTGYYCYLRGYTLTKTGAGALTCTNMNTPGTGTIDLQGGAMTVNQWNNLNSGSGNTTLTLREGASFTQNSSSHQIAVDTLNFVGGTLNTPNPFYVKSLLTGAGETAKLVFRDGATIEPTGELKVTGELSLDGSLTVSTARINPAEIAVGQTIDLLTAPVGTTLSSDAITVKSSSRFETAISDNKVTATAVALKNFLHYDFNGGASIAADSTYSLNSGPDPEYVGGWNGDAGVFDSTCTPWYDSNSSGKSPFHAGEMTVTTLLKIREAENTILWNLGDGWGVGMALIAKDASTISLVSWTGGADGSDVVSVSGIGNLMNKWHLVTIVANEDGTTLYVDDQYATVSTLLPSDIDGKGQFGSIHGKTKNYTAVSGDGFLLDDWRVYDAALTHAEVKALKSELLPKPFNFILR